MKTENTGVSKYMCVYAQQCTNEKPRSNYPKKVTTPQTGSLLPTFPSKVTGKKKKYWALPPWVTNNLNSQNNSQ